MLKKSLKNIFPVIPTTATSATVQYQSKAGEMRGRGRPKGSVTYSIPGKGPVGVFEYRAYISQQKRALIQQLRQQVELAKIQRQIDRTPQYESMPYKQQVQGQQVPAELQGQGYTADYTQYQQEQQAQPQQQVVYRGPMPQQVQQAPQQMPQKRPIVPVFKSSGGSPYTIPQEGLTPTKETIPYGYVEAVDSFTGRRYMKPLPPKERWSSAQ